MPPSEIPTPRSVFCTSVLDAVVITAFLALVMRPTYMMSPQTLENVHFSKNYVEILCAAASRGTPVPGLWASLSPSPRSLILSLATSICVHTYEYMHTLCIEAFYPKAMGIWAVSTGLYGLDHVYAWVLCGIKGLTLSPRPRVTIDLWQGNLRKFPLPT